MVGTRFKTVSQQVGALVCGSAFACTFWLVTCGNASASSGDATIAGTIDFDGERPNRRQIPLVGKDGKPSDCHQLHKEGLLDDNLLVGENGQLANVFVYIKNGLPKQDFPVPAEPAVLDQDHCMFQPRVQGVMVGQELLMRNSDPVIHNVRSLSLRNRAFNFGQPANTPDRSRIFNKRERKIKIQCDFHPWMTAYVFVMDHPYFAVTNESGQFKIDGIPPGDYTIAAWHEELGEQERLITVSKGRKVELAFAFKPKANSNQKFIQPNVTSAIDDSSAAPKKKRRFVKMWQTSDFTDESTVSTSDSVTAGRAIFEEAGCVKCHVVSGAGAKLGPDLTDVSKRFKGSKLIEQVLTPSSEIHKEFQTQVFMLDDGRVLTGLVIKEDTETIHLLANALKPDEITLINVAVIEERSTSKLSTMPEGLLITFKKNEILDLLAYLRSSGKVN